MSQILQINPDDAVEGFTDDQLVMAHMTTHAYYREFRQGRSEQIENWTMEELVQKHDEIRSEMEKRELKHERINALDEEAATVAQSADDEQTDTEWLFQAEDFIDVQDDRINLSEHVQLSSTPYADLAEWIQTWADKTFSDTSEIGVVAHEVNQEGNYAAFMTKQSDGYRLFLNDVEVFQSEYQDVALERFISLSENVEQSDGIKQAFESTFVDQEVVESEDLDEEVEQSDVDQFRVIENADEDYKWYVWNKTEVEQWLSDQGYEDAELEHDGNFLKANIPQDVEQAHPSSVGAIANTVRTVDQQGDGDAVVVRGAENENEEFFLATHLVGDEIEMENAANLTEAMGISGPYPADQMILPTAFMVDDPIPDGRRFFVVQWTNEDGEPGEIVTDEDIPVLDDAIYHQTPGVESGPSEEVVQNTGTYRSWRGSRIPPEEITQDNKPRRIVVESGEEGSQVKQIEFPIRRSYAQTAALVTEEYGFDQDTLEGLLRECN